MITIPNDTFFSMVEKEISRGNSVHLRVKGQSMYPLLRDRKDEVILHPCTCDELEVMDVILFKYNGNYVLHRIIKMDASQLYMRGDGAFKAMEHCPKTDVIAKVASIIRPYGKVISVKDWRWRLPSQLWRRTGVLRSPLLRIMRHFASF